MVISYMKEKKIDYCDVDMNSMWRLSHLLNELSGIATEHALQLGLWHPTLLRDYGWVVSKQRLHFYHPITLNQYVKIKTWVGKNSAAIFPRYYQISDENDKILAVGNSIWTLLDLKRRRIVMPQRVGVTIPTVEEDQAPIERPESFEIPFPLAYQMTRKVYFSDIDTNQHMNNARYLEWVCDLVDLEDMTSHMIEDMTIFYKKEIPPMSQVKLYLGKNQECFVVRGTDEQDQVIYFEVKCMWRTLSCQ